MSEKYSHARHVDKVVKASKARCAARAVLLEICRRADFGKPETTFTKGQLIDCLGYTRRTIQLALQFLRDEGSIVPIANFAGGKGNATTYRLCIVGQGASEAPKEDRAGDEAPEIFAQIMAKYSLVDEAGFANWLKQCKFEELAGGVLVMRAPNTFAASHISQHMADRLAQVANSVSPDIERVKVKA